MVTEPFADKHHLRTGDVMHIPLGAHTAALTVSGIYYDYSSDRGTVLVDRSTLLKYLPDQPITNIAVYIQPGADATKVRRDLETRLGDFPLMIAPNEVLRRAAVEVFDRTFAVTYALEAVAIVVAMLGAANSLLALVLDRRREIGLHPLFSGPRCHRTGPPDDPHGSRFAWASRRIAGFSSRDGAFGCPDLRGQQAELWLDDTVPSAGLSACGRVVAGVGRKGPGRRLPGTVRRKAPAD